MTLYKTGSESQTFCCNFKNLHLCSLNQRLIFQKGPNNQNTVKKMILNLQYISNTPNIFTDYQRIVSAQMKHRFVTFTYNWIFTNKIIILHFSTCLQYNTVNQNASASRGQQRLSRLVGKPTMWFPNRSDTNRPVQAQKRVRSLKFRI